jgi:hypothetical protein
MKIVANYSISQYKNVKSPNVDRITSSEQFLFRTKNGDENLEQILIAREAGKGSEEYNRIKTEVLTTFRFNFMFATSASNANITLPTGLIYIDVDSIDIIPNNDYIYAKWKSLSNTGYGLLVKVENLNQLNFKDSYATISKLIGIESDLNAAKPTQQTVLSFDNDLFLNNNSIVFDCKATSPLSPSINPTNSFTNSKVIKLPIKQELKEIDNKVSYQPILKKEEGRKGIDRDDTCFQKSNYKIRFNNIDDYFEDDAMEYIVFDEKKSICNPFIPRSIREGTRNKTVFFLLSQYALLNPLAGIKFLNAIGETINSSGFFLLPKQELNAIVMSVLKKRKEGTLQLFLNQERKIIFNPKAKMNRKEKMQIVNRELGKIKSSKTQNRIYQIIENWDFENDGDIIQKKVAIKVDTSLTTIKRYWHFFKEFVIEVSNDFKLKQNKTGTE